MPPPFPPAVQRKSAFTLLEILVVISIIAILAGITLAISGGANQKAALDKIRAEVLAIANAIEQFKIANDTYPAPGANNSVPFADSGETIRPFYSAANFKTNSSGQLADPYDNAYFYRIPGTKNPATFDIFSCGRDQAPDTEDDIGNW